jgi:hypothetical protein
MPLSSDPEARARSLANLRAGAGAGDGGLQRGRTHGVYAQIAARELDGKVRELYDAIGSDLPVRDPDGAVPAQDAIPLRILAETLIRRGRVSETELRHGIETPDGRLRGIVEFGLRLDGQALRLCEQMGLTPAARAKLGLDLVRAQSHADRQLDALASEGRRIREAREADALADDDQAAEQ